jgi:hypothetical protein
MVWDQTVMLKNTIKTVTTNEESTELKNLKMGIIINLPTHLAAWRQWVL